MPSVSGMLLLAGLVIGGCSTVVRQPSTPSPAAHAASASRPDSGGVRLQPYRELVPVTAMTDSGLFVTHRVKEKLYYEIPRDVLGAEMLLVTTIARNTDGEFGGSPVSNRLIRWERHGARIFLRSPSYELTADRTLPVYEAVAAATYAPILASFPIAAWSPDSAAVIEVTELFTGGVPELGTNHEGTLEKDRTFIERVAAYPENIEVEATHTRTVKVETPGVPREYAPPPQSRSIVLHWSMVRLPAEPMMPRRFDERVGYFSIGKTDFGGDSHEVEQYRYINRWRLECAVGAVSPCEPLQPIVFYVDPATPAQWVPWVKRGVEAWQPAFERAGYRNAIVVRDAPTAQQDPDWSPEDARYSVIRWMASTYENAMGPHVHDPRTGEILEADIHMYHNVLKLVRDWYFVQVAPVDVRAQKLPMPDSLMGRLLQYIVSHEVGHTLGLQHNMKASSTFPLDSLRDESFLRRMGHIPSIMDYSRFNYVVQPEDRLPPELLVPRIGAYDEFAIMWGYRTVAGAESPEAEAPVLNEWARMQDTIPWYRFSTMGADRADAGQLAEAVGDEDAVRATRLGLQNIRRTVPLLIPATVRPGESFDDLDELYGALVDQWQTELEHVAAIPGGVESREKHGGQDGWRFVSLPVARQREAVAFLVREAFQTPEYLLDREILNRIEIHGTLERIGDAQRAVLQTLLNDRRMERMIEDEALSLPGAPTYSLGEMLADLRQGIWSELSSGDRSDAFRRRLQYSYLDIIDQKLNPAPERENRRGELSQQVKALLRGELHALAGSIQAAAARARHRETRLHLENAGTRIARILDPHG